jgi:hypothetical protein
MGALFPVTACAALFIAAGGLDDAVYANVTFNHMYFGSTPFLQPIDHLLNMPRIILLGGLTFWLIAGIGVMRAATRRERHDGLLLLFALGSFAGVKMSGLDYAHYYVQLLPPVALLGGLALPSMFGTRRRRLAGALLLWLPLVFNGALYLDSITPASDRAEAVGVRDCEASAPEIGAYIHSHTPDGARIYNVGRDAEIYYYADRLPATRFFYDRTFLADPATVTETTGALSAAPPTLVVDTRDLCPLAIPVPPEIDRLIASSYVLDATVAGARIYIRQAQQSPSP